MMKITHLQTATILWNKTTGGRRRIKLWNLQGCSQVQQTLLQTPSQTLTSPNHHEARRPVGVQPISSSYKELESVMPTNFGWCHPTRLQSSGHALRSLKVSRANCCKKSTQINHLTASEICMSKKTVPSQSWYLRFVIARLVFIGTVYALSGIGPLTSFASKLIGPKYVLYIV